MSEQSQKNSFVSIAEQIALLNKNAVEILTKLSDVVGSNASSVQINYIDDKGLQSQYALPTVGALKQQIDIANNNIQRLSQFNDKSTYIIDGNSTKKVYQVDLNREPSQINGLSTINQFSSINNWFFESLMNPLLAVEIDLTDIVDEDVTKVLSRRYIIQFLKNADGTLTIEGQASKDDFNSKFANRNDINFSEFLDWFNNPTNVGVVGNNNPNYQSYDEQVFELDYNELKDYGVFSVLKQELDSVNGKLFYHFNSLNYFDLSGTTKTLGVGDELILNKKNSSTRYAVIEINTQASNNRVRLERIEGYDPVPTGVNTLKFYSGIKLSKRIKLTIGFDELNLVFLKPINGTNNIISTLWSKGVSFYTNDLKLVTDSKVNLSKYYLDYVYDYGMLLKDMVKKQIPSSVGLTPNAPNLVSDNFKVVQINTHLTDTEDIRKVRELHSQKNQVKTQIDQLNDAINLKNKDLQRRIFKTVAEKSKVENELNKLNGQLENSTKLLNSITTQITSSNIDTTVEPKFRLRGFWDIPTARTMAGFRDQEVVQFEIQYRYSSKSGKENATEGYTINSNTDETQSQTGYFSNWVSVLSDVRERYYDEVSQEYKWKIEEVWNADTVNINQLDIPIQKGEKVDVRIRSISEVGYPDSLIKSEWSNTLTYEFPDELNSVLNSNDFILKEASDDSLKLEFEGTLGAKGYTKHIEESFTMNQQYFAHTDKTIQTSFVDSNGDSLSLFDYLNVLTNKINSLEEIVSRSKGELQVLVFRNTDEHKISNGSTLNFTVECEDYAVASGTTPRVYKNSIYLISDFYIRIDNIATANSLGLLSDRKFVNTGTTASNTFYKTKHLVAVVDNNNLCRTQRDNQFIWFADSDGGNDLNSNIGVPIDGSANGATPTALSNDSKNIGLASGTTYINSNPFNMIGGNINWNGYNEHQILTTVHPNIANIYDLVENGQEKTKYIAPSNSLTIPINIYFKLEGTASPTINLGIVENSNQHNKKIKVFLESTNLTRPFEFVINFNLKQRKNYNI